MVVRTGEEGGGEEESPRSPFASSSAFPCLTPADDEPIARRFSDLFSEAERGGEGEEEEEEEEKEE